MVLSIWAVTPLQSGIFNVALTTMVHHISISPPARLPPLSQQRNVLGGNLLNAAYGVPWLEQALPPFTTREFSLAPFSWHALESAGKNASLVANTTLYRSELSCSAPASVKPAAGEPSGVFEVDDGQGCKQKTRTSAPTNGFQIQACNKYFIVWHDERADVSNVSRVVTRFCQTAYYSQPVQANVSLPDGTVIQTWPLGPQSALAGHEFNSSLFEYIVNIGLAPGIGKNATNLHEKTPRPYPVAEDTVLSQTLRLSQHGFPHVNSIMGGLALGQQNLPFDRFIQSPEAIDSAYNSAQQLLFALAVSSVSKPFAVSGASHPAIHTFSIQSVQLVSAFTRSVQLCLGLIVILTTVLAFWYYNKFLPFGSDPNSIGFLAALASRHKFLEYFKSLDREEDFVPRLRHRQATLRSRDGPLSLSLDNADHGSDIYDSTETNGLAECRAKKGMQYRVQNTWPTELKLPAGLAFALTLFLLIATLLFLDTWTRSHRGLPLPSENTIARQIILNFIPTVRSPLYDMHMGLSWLMLFSGLWDCHRTFPDRGLPLPLLPSAIRGP